MKKAIKISVLLAILSVASCIAYAPYPNDYYYYNTYPNPDYDSFYYSAPYGRPYYPGIRRFERGERHEREEHRGRGDHRPGRER